MNNHNFHDNYGFCNYHFFTSDIGVKREERHGEKKGKILKGKERRDRGEKKEGRDTGGGTK
jgi:hypothetical protein